MLFIKRFQLIRKRGYRVFRNRRKDLLRRLVLYDSHDFFGRRGRRSKHSPSRQEEQRRDGGSGRHGSEPPERERFLFRGDFRLDRGPESFRLLLPEVFKTVPQVFFPITHCCFLLYSLICFARSARARKYWEQELFSRIPSRPAISLWLLFSKTNRLNTVR